MDKQKSMISYITLGVSDLAKMQSFYTSFGFELQSESENLDHPFAMYKSGGVILALYPKDLLAKQSGTTIEMSNENKAMSLSLNVESKVAVDDYLSLAKQLNMKITKEAFEPAWGGYCGYFKDPENNLWEIVWHEKFMFSV